MAPLAMISPSLLAIASLERPVTVREPSPAIVRSAVLKRAALGSSTSALAYW